MSARAVGLSRDLPAGRVMPAHVAGQDLALWRSVSGVLSAWDNRCPHRGMALSHGFVRGETLACLYHGWHFGCDRRCSLIPSHPDLNPPETIQTQAFPVVEADGVIWVALSGEAQATADLSGFKPLRSLEFRTDEAAVLPIKRLGGVAVKALLNPMKPASDGSLRTLVTCLIAETASLEQIKAALLDLEALRERAEGKGAS